MKPPGSCYETALLSCYGGVMRAKHNALKHNITRNITQNITPLSPAKSKVKSKCVIKLCYYYNVVILKVLGILSIPIVSIHVRARETEQGGAKC